MSTRAPTERILIVAGEVSGDIHAGNLLGELRRRRPALEAFGVGGERLQQEGLECLAHTSELAHMGLVEVLREVPRIRRILLGLVDEAVRRRPAVAVLVDSPDFNLRLAKKLGRRGIPVVLYVSPQLWAWRRGRVRLVRRVAREVLCLLPFEPGFYHQHGVAARFVGHPLVDDFVRSGLLGGERGDPGGRRLGMLPGSRVMEVRHLLPSMIRALGRLGGEEVEEAVLVEAPGVTAAVDEVLARVGTDPRVRRVTGDGRRAELQGCVAAWTASGTATLECALLGVPMVVGYRLEPLSYAVARLLVRVPHVALVNLIAGRRVAPELLQKRWNPDELAAATRRLLAGDGAAQRESLAEVRRRLGEPGASSRAADAVEEHLGARVGSAPGG